MSEKKLKAQTPKSNDLTLYRSDGTSFDVPIIARLTPRLYDQLLPIIEAYTSEMESEAFPLISQHNALTDEEEKQRFQKEHALELLEETQRITKRVNAMSLTHGAPAENVRRHMKYILDFVPYIIDREALDEADHALLDKAEFWKDQDLERLTEAVQRFRKRMGGHS